MDEAGGAETQVVVRSEGQDADWAAIDRARLVVYESEPAKALAMRLVVSERAVDDLTGTIRALLLKEQSELGEAVEDRKRMADKLGSVLKNNVSRASWKQLLEENSGLKREMATIKRENPMAQENLELRRKVELLELRLAGRFDEAEVRQRGYADLQRIERSEADALARARGHRAAAETIPVPYEGEPDE